MTSVASLEARFGTDWPLLAHSEYVRTGSIAHHIQRFGSTGPKFLLLHGSGASSHSMRFLASILARHGSVLVPDLPGHGGTETARGKGMTLPGVASHVAALCNEIDFQPDLAIGHSAGAAIAIEMALQGDVSPRAILGVNAALEPIDGYSFFSPLAKLLFANPFVPSLFSTFGARETTARRLIDQTGSAIDDEGVEYYRRLFADSEHVRGALAMMANWDLKAFQRRLPGLKVPLVLLAAEDDATVPARNAPKHIARVRTGTLIAVPSGGHLVHEQRPELVAGHALSIMSEAGLPLAS